MSAATILEKVSAAFRKREEARAQSFNELVAKVTAGKEPKADEVADILEAAGKTIDDLAAAVKLVEDRREWRRLLATCPAFDTAWSENQRRGDAELERFAKLEAEHDQIMSAIQADQERIRAERPNHTDLQSKLWEADSPEKHARHAELIEQQRRLRVTIMDLQHKAREIESQPLALKADRGEQHARTVLTDYQRLLDRAAELRAEAATLQPQVDKLGVEAEALQRSAWE